MIETSQIVHPFAVKLNARSLSISHQQNAAKTIFQITLSSVLQTPIRQCHVLSFINAAAP